MKICIFSDARMVHIQRLCPGLAERGLEVHVVCHNPVDIPGVTVERFQIPRPGLGNLRRWRGRWSGYLRGFLRRFDVVNVHFLHDWGFTPQLIERGCLVATPWGSDIIPPPGGKPPPPDLVESRVALLRHADGITACGPTFACTVAEFAGLDPDRVQVVPFGVNLSLFQPPRPSQVGRLSSGVVGFFKGFWEVYGPKCLLRAIPMVLDALPAARFEFVGDGVQLDECKALAVKLGVDSAVRWIPRQPNHRMPQYLAGWDLTVIPSVQEAFGVAALESSAMCVPVVASDVGGLRDTVIDHGTGRLVPPNRPDELAATMIELLKDAPLRRRMGQAGRAFVECEYALESVLDQWSHMYETVLDQTCVMV